MAVAFTFSPPLPFRAVESRANPLSLNILHVSTFASKILRAVQQPRPNELKDLACPTSGATARMAQFQQLSPILSRFYVQLLWIQRLLVFSRQADDSKRSPGEGYTPTGARSKMSGMPPAVHCPLTDTFECGMQKLIWWSRS